MGKIMAVSLADKAEEYVGFAQRCLKIARSLPNRDDRVAHREMAAEWIKLAQMMTDKAAHDAREQVGQTGIRAVS
jgi:hypothetical protein